MKNLIFLFALFFVQSVAFGQLSERDKAYVPNHAINENPSFLEGKSGWEVTNNNPTGCFEPVTKSNGLEILCLDVGDRSEVTQSIPASEFNMLRLSEGMYVTLFFKYDITNSSTDINLTVAKISGSTTTPLHNKTLVYGDSGVYSVDIYLPYLAPTDLISLTANSGAINASNNGLAYFSDFRIFSSSFNYSPLISNNPEQTGWTDWQPITITAQTTNPTKGVTVYDQCRKRRSGTQLEIEFNYYQSSAGTAGSGKYYFMCGGNTFNFNGENLTVDYDPFVDPKIGVSASNSFFSSISSSTPLLTAFIRRDSGDRIYLRSSEGSDASSDSAGMDRTYIGFRLTVSIAIKEWKQSSLSATQLSDASNAESWGDFVFFVNSNGSIVNNNSQGVVGTSASISDTSTYSIALSGLTSPPICIPGTRNPSNVSATTISSSASSLVVRTYATQSNAPIASSMEVVCFKTENDRLKAFKQYINGQFRESNIVKDVTARYIVKTFRSGYNWYEINNDCWVRQSTLLQSITPNNTLKSWNLLIKYSPRLVAGTLTPVGTSVHTSGEANPVINIGSSDSTTLKYFYNGVAAVNNLSVILEGNGDKEDIEEKHPDLIGTLRCD